MSRGELPPGKLEKVRTIANYNRLDGETPAGFQASAADTVGSEALRETLATDGTEGKPVWNSHAPDEEIRAGGAKATRSMFHTGTGREKGTRIRDIYIFERGELIWMFSGMYDLGDSQARDTVRRAIDSLEWK